MAYEYEWKEIEIVVKEDYLKLKRKAKAWDNYMIDTYIYDKVYSDGDHKEAYDFYMKPDVKSYIDCLNKELADTGHFINSVEEYKQILNEIEDKQND